MTWACIAEYPSENGETQNRSRYSGRGNTQFFQFVEHWLFDIHYSKLRTSNEDIKVDCRWYQTMNKSKWTWAGSGKPHKILVFVSERSDVGYVGYDQQNICIWWTSSSVELLFIQDLQIQHHMLIAQR